MTTTTLEKKTNPTTTAKLGDKLTKEEVNEERRGGRKCGLTEKTKMRAGGAGDWWRCQLFGDCG